MIPNAAPQWDNSPTRIGDVPPGGFSLAGPSAHPDPAIHAFRKDLADVALVGVVIASHYAEPLDHVLARDATLRDRPSGEILAELPAGTAVGLLDRGRDWSWGYAGGRVGYLPSAAL